MANIAPAPKAAPAASPLTGNFTLTSDYRFRGISQSYKLPAVQGGIGSAKGFGFGLLSVAPLRQPAVGAAGRSA